MVRWHITIEECPGCNHEHIVDVTPREVATKGVKKEGREEVSTNGKEEIDPYKKKEVYTTAYDCRQKKFLATFKGEQVYRDDTPPNLILKVSDVRELTEGDDLDWLTYDREEQQGLSAYFIERADKYNEIWVAVFTIYSGLLVLFGFMVSGGSLNQVTGLKALVFLLPIVAWLFGIYFFFQIHTPSVQTMTPNSPAEIRERFYKSNVEKAKNYRKGLTCFSIGILLVACALFVGIFWTSPSDTPGENVVFIIKDEFVEKVREIPISMIPETNMTTVVQLYNTTESGYRIGLDDGTMVELDKNWVTNIVRVSNTTQQGSQTA